MPLTIESAARKDRRTAQNNPTLDHRHFAFIAATIADMLPVSPTPSERKHWRATVDHFADSCAGTNPRFDRARFLSACGLQS